MAGQKHVLPVNSYTLKVVKQKFLDLSLRLTIYKTTTVLCLGTADDDRIPVTDEINKSYIVKDAGNYLYYQSTNDGFLSRYSLIIFCVHPFSLIISL